MRNPSQSVETLMETFDIPLFLVRRNKILYLNQAGSSLTGYTQPELIQKNIRDFLPDEEFREFASRKTLRQLARGQAVKKEVRIVQKSGKEHFAELTLRRVFWENSRALLGSFPNHISPSSLQSKINPELERIAHERAVELEKLNRQMQEDFITRRKIETRLRDSLKSANQALQKTVQALSMVSEQRDPYTAGHQKRVSKLACAIAHKAGLPASVVEGIGFAGILHDIGKIQLPFEILNKPGLLSEIEMKLIQTHPAAGYEILKNIPFERPIARIVLEHHERLDGSGYPQHLKENEILIESKVLAIADVVEAIASHRPYRPALGLETALETIENHPELYDTGMARTCISLFREEGFRLE